MHDDKEFQSGVRLDDRPQAQKDLDFQFHELVSAPDPVNWKAKKRTEFRKFPIFNQDGSGSCVAQTLRKLLGIMVWLMHGVYLDFSASDIYGRRFNKPEGGMNAGDAFKIATEGVTLNALMPSDLMNDAQMDAVASDPTAKAVGKIFAIKQWISLPIGDIETVASVIQKTGKGVMGFHFWKYEEYTDIPKVLYPNMGASDPSVARHSTAMVDFTLFDQTNAPNNPELWGKKGLVMDDSWDKVATAMEGQRILSEDFIKARNFYFGYAMNFVFQVGSPDNKPSYHFDTTKTLRYDPKAPVVYNNPDVVALQNILKYEAFFPSNSQSTGYFGSITQASLKKWQSAHGLLADGIAGFKTLSLLNTLYA